MRKHGWELPYHPLQVVAVAVFLALGFAFYVFFSPFVGSKLFQYIIMGIYTPLIITAFGLYIWSAATDPADPGVFKSKKYLKTIRNNKHTHVKESKLCVESTSSIQEPNGEVKEEKNITEMRKEANLFTRLKVLLPCFIVCNCSKSEESIEQHMSEEGMFYCSLCEVEVHKNSKHCRVCDKCVDSFDHHCRWLNNCVGKRNYRKFFTLMVSSLLLLILQWSTGILVLIMCFLERKRFSIDITKNLGSSFTLVPFLIVVGVCTILAMIATLPLVQLFFFHILLIKKGISTYDYIIALREQDQVGTEAQQSPQMSPISSIGVSSVSSFNTFQRAAWCTPPRLFVEDQFDVVPPETGSVSSLGKKSPTKKKAPVKISPWTLARLNTEEVTKAAAQARKKSKILQPVTRRHALNNRNNSINNAGSSSFASLQLEARSVFNTSRAIVASSPESSSLDSPDLHPFRVSVEGRQMVGFSRSTSDGYDASGGEDSDRVSTRIMQRSINWSNLLFGSGHNEIVNKLNVPSSSSHT